VIARNSAFRRRAAAHRLKAELQTPPRLLGKEQSPMTEREWLITTDPVVMLKYLRGKTTDRKLELFKLACLRNIWELVADGLSRSLIDVGEQLLDGRVADTDWLTVCDEFLAKLQEGANPAVETLARRGSDKVASAIETALASASAVADASVWPLLQMAAPHYTQTFQEEGWNRECAAQSNILRHIIGNPLRPYPAPASWPWAVVKLAEAVYAGEDCSFALHDALLEAGNPELAEHFQTEKWHPKGCWVVDMIAGKS
jgi:hypothetical protein